MAQAKHVKPLWAYCLAILDLVQPGMRMNIPAEFRKTKTSYLYMLSMLRQIMFIPMIILIRSSFLYESISPAFRVPRRDPGD